MAVAQERLLLDGQWIETGRIHEVRSPYSGELVGRVARGGAEQARRAIDAAAQAMTEPLPAHRRAEILDAMAALVRERREQLARTVCAEAGKPIRAARVEAERCASTLTASAAVARTLTGETIPMDASSAGAGRLGFTLRVPVGVVGAISPFNFPLNLVAHKLGPAIAAGCGTVLKPASQTPLSALALAGIAMEAGLPRGWLNVIVGPAGEIGDVLVEDDRVGLITFTGSAEVGWRLRERAARKRVALELGNSTPVLVAGDADLDTASAKLAAGAFGFAGQSCISVQRIYVERPVAQSFLERLVRQAEALCVGDPADEETDVGPVIDGDSRERIREWIQEALDAGASLVTGGEPREGLLPPTVLTDVSPTAKVSCREVFGPLCTVTPYETLDQAIALANGTPYGLQAGVFTASLDTALRAARRLEFGGVTINETPTFRADQMPYGGVKASGNTKEGPAYAAREMTEERLVLFAES